MEAALWLNTVLPPHFYLIPFITLSSASAALCVQSLKLYQFLMCIQLKLFTFTLQNLFAVFCTCKQDELRVNKSSTDHIAAQWHHAINCTLKCLMCLFDYDIIVFSSNVLHRIPPWCFLMAWRQEGIWVTVEPVESVFVFVCCCSQDARSNYALTSSTASVQFHSCGEEDILIGSFFAISPQSSQLGAENIALGGEGQGAQWVGSIIGSGLVNSEQLVAVSVSCCLEEAEVREVAWGKCVILVNHGTGILTQSQNGKCGIEANAEPVATFA